MKNIKDELRDSRYKNKKTYHMFNRSPSGREKKKCEEAIFIENKADNCPKFKKEILILKRLETIFIFMYRYIYYMHINPCLYTF